MMASFSASLTSCQRVGRCRELERNAAANEICPMGQKWSIVVEILLCSMDEGENSQKTSHIQRILKSLFSHIIKCFFKCQKTTFLHREYNFTFLSPHGKPDREAHTLVSPLKMDYTGFLVLLLRWRTVSLSPLPLPLNSPSSPHQS